MIAKLEEKLKDTEKESDTHLQPHSYTQERTVEVDRTALESNIIKKTETEMVDTDKDTANNTVTEAPHTSGGPESAGQVEAEKHDTFSEEMYLAALRRNMELKRQIYELKSLQNEPYQSQWTSAYRSA